MASKLFLEKAYLAYFGRPVDATGAVDFANSTEAEVAAAFSASPESKALFGPTFGASQINLIYQTLFGRVAETEGIAYWLHQVELGLLTPTGAAMGILGGARNADITSATNKLAASSAFTTSLDTPSEKQGYAGNDAAAAARDFLKGVTSTAPTKIQLDKAVEGVVASGNHTVGKLFTLTEVAPEMVKSFLWQGVDTASLKAMLAYANEVNNRGGNLVTDAKFTDTTGGTGESLFFDSAWVEALNDYINKYPTLVDETVKFNPARLTTTGATVGVVEAGNATAGNDLIVAGTSYALHGAYIDGGAGYNTLEVEMKGPFAQAKELLNIQEVHIENASDYYAPALFGYNNSGRGTVGTVNLNQFLQNGAQDGGGSSIIDLTNARELQKLVITESGSNDNLIVLGIRNYVHTKLEGGFDKNVTLHYTTGQKAVLNLELANVDFGTASAQGNLNSGKLILGHNAGTVSIDSEGASNVLGGVDFGARFQKLVVTGTALLAIEENLEFAWGTATVDASTNTGGLIMTVGTQVPGSLTSVNIIGSQANDKIAVTGTPAGVLLNIDLGTGINSLSLQAGVDAGAKSVITGENLTVTVTGAAENMLAGTGVTTAPVAVTNLTKANISGVDAFVLDQRTDASSTLIITAAQFKALGADKFTAAHADSAARLQIAITADTNFADLGDMTTLGAGVKLAFTIAQGAILTVTAQQLDKYFAEKAIVMGEVGDAAITGLAASQGKLVITNAGLNFDWSNSSTVASPEQAYLKGGTVANTWATSGNNITVVRAIDGFDRDSAAVLSDVLTIDSTATAVTVAANALGSPVNFDLSVKTMVIKGTNDVTFSAPVDFTNANDTNFKIDASALTGKLNGLTIAEFNKITTGGDTTWGSVKGTAGNDRINVQLTGNVGTGATVATGGLKSTGVETYVVTSLDVSRTFNVCDTTVGLTTLGLQGNAGKSITFNNAKFNVNFLLEGDGQADWTALPKVAGNPNYSNVGTLNAKYFAYDENFTANVLVNNRGVALGLKTDGVTSRELHVDGINIDNAKSANIVIENGAVVIAGINATGANQLVNVKLTSAKDVTLTLNAAASSFKTLDASDVVGKAIVVIGNTDASFTPTYGDDNLAIVDLSSAAVTGVDAIKIIEGGTLSLSIAQLTAIGAANVTVIDGSDALTTVQTATLNLVGLDATPFSVATFDSHIVLGTITVATLASGVVTLDATTNLTDVPGLVIPEGMTLNLSAAQFQQLRGIGSIANNGTVNITGLTQADVNAGLDFSGITNVAKGKLGTITLAENVVLKDTTLLKDAQVKYTVNGDTVNPVTAQFLPETVAGLVYKLVENVGFAVVLAANQQITFANAAQAHDRVVTGAAGSQVNLSFTAAALTNNALAGAANPLVDFHNGVADTKSGINTAYYTGIAALQVKPGLIVNSNLEQTVANLDKTILVKVLEVVVAGDVANPTYRNIEVLSDTSIAGSLVIENLNSAKPDYLKLTDIALTLDGGSSITGLIDISGTPILTLGFKTLTINSTGTKANALGNIQAGLDAAGTGNDLLDVKINATGADLTIGKIALSAAALNADSTGKAATVTVTGTKNVTIESLDTTDGEVGTVNVVNSLTGGAVLTITGGSPAIDGTVTTKLETLNLSGSGAINLGTKVNGNGNGSVGAAAANDYFEPGIQSATLSLIDATSLSGALNLGRIELVDGKSFSFKSGTGLTTLSLDDRDDATNALALAANTAVGSADTGWSFDLSKAAAGSALTINSTTTLTSGVLNINLGTAGNKVVLNGNVAFGAGITGFNITGTNGTLELTANSKIDFRQLADAVVSPAAAAELGLAGIKNIVLDAGASVQMSNAEYAAYVAAGGTITGPGTTYLVQNTNGADAIDLTFHRGLTAVQLDHLLTGPTADAVVLSSDQALVAYDATVKYVGSTTVIESVSRSMWDDNADDMSGTAAGKTPFVARADGDFRGIAANVTVMVTKTVDISGLQGVDAIVLPNDTTPATQHDIALTIHQSAADDQLSVLNTAAGATSIATELVQLSSLKINVAVDLGTTDLQGNHDIQGSFFTSVYDAVANKWTVSGNAAAIATAVKSQVNSSMTDLLATAKTINWTEVGTTASKFITVGTGSDLAAVTNVADVFKFIAVPDVVTNELVITNFDLATDKVNFDLMTADTAFTAVTGNLTAASDKIYFLGAQAAGSADSADAAADALNAAAVWANAGATATTAYVVVADDNSTAIYKWVDVASSSNEVASTELTLVGTIDAALTTANMLFA